MAITRSEIFVECERVRVRNRISANLYQIKISQSHLDRSRVQWLAVIGLLKLGHRNELINRPMGVLRFAQLI